MTTHTNVTAAHAGAVVWRLVLTGAMMAGVDDVYGQEHLAEHRVVASWAGHEVTETLVREFENTRGIRLGRVSVCDGNQVITRMQRSETVLGIVQDGMVPRSQQDLYAGLESRRIGTVSVAVIVNSQSGTRQLTLEDLGDAFRGRIREWDRVKGVTARGPIELFGLVHTTTESIVMRLKCMDGDLFRKDYLKLPWPEDGHTIRQKVRPAAVVEAVAAERQAIGFIPWHPRSDLLDKRVTIVRIVTPETSAGVLPSQETITDGSYPLFDTLTLFLPPNASDAVREFMKYTTGPESVEIIRRHGLWPEYELELVRAEQRVADVKAGKGQPVAVCDLAGVDEAIKAAALEFARAKMAVQVTLDAGGGSVEAAVAKLKTGEAELMVVDGGMEETLRGPVMEEGGEGMVLGSRAVGVVVHPGNSFHELTMDDLRQILAGKVDRWPGATGTAERIVLYALPATNPLMPLMDRAMGPDLKRAKATVRPDSERVILSVAAQPGSLGLVDLTKISRHETKVKLLAVIPPRETEAAPQAPDRVPEGYPLASPVALHLSPKASDAAQAFFAFLKEGGGRDALLAGGLVPRPLPDATEAEVAAAYGPADGPEAAGPPAQVAAAKEDDSPATAAPDHLQDVLRGALGGPAGASPSGVAPVAAQAGADQTAESAAAESTPLDPDRSTPRPRQAEETEAIQPAPGEGSVPHPAASELPPAGEGNFAAWITARAVPIGLIGLGVTAVAVALGSLGMKRARHRKEVMRRYRP